MLIPLSGCGGKPPGKSTPGLSHLQKIRHAGFLKVLTRYSYSSYHQGAAGPSGLEHDLVDLFAKRLGVSVKFIIPDSDKEILRRVKDGEADLAAAALYRMNRGENGLRFGPSYRTVKEQLVYHADFTRPQSIGDLSPGLLEVSAGSGHIESLKQIKRQRPAFSWNVNFDQDRDGLLLMVNEGLLDYTIADSDLLLSMRRFYPHLEVAFDLAGVRELAWALPSEDDDSLYREVMAFFEDIKRTKVLDQLIDRYYGHTSAYDPALDNGLRQDYRRRLPKYRRLFMRAAEQYDMDWRLLAAIAYQESKWDRGATSAEGVRGIMQIIGTTAKELKLNDLFDPAQSIRGGASYLQELLANLSAEIQDPDRTWMALAAYNLGPGHLDDARELTRKRGGDPNKWIDVKKSLALLGKPEWHRRTRHGYARGAGAVHYVQNIRRYYDLLVWLTEEEQFRRLALGILRNRGTGA